MAGAARRCSRAQRPSRAIPDVPAAWLDPAIASRWAELRELRRVVTGAL